MQHQRKSPVPRKVVIAGAGMAGLASAIELAAKGVRVTLLEKEAAPGGKMREIEVDGVRIDAGPTVFTMRWVFEELFAAAGARFGELVPARPADIIARHAWGPHERLDLFCDVERSAEAVAAFSSRSEAERFRVFCREARQVYETLEGPFISSHRPTALGLAADIGMGNWAALTRIKPFTTLWRALGGHFRDERLRQLFGRYATYCGSSPYEAPATLMLVAHVEQAGVWLVEGGMHRLARAMADLAVSRGAEIRYGEAVAEIPVEQGRVAGVTLGDGERIAADAVIFNGDVAALAQGLLGEGVSSAVARVPPSARSLSALTLAAHAQPTGFPLVHHNVFFSGDYKAEFDDIFLRRRLPREPTVYVCAQDRAASEAPAPEGRERLFVLINAPATGDRHEFTEAEIDACKAQGLALLERCGLTVDLDGQAMTATTPSQFHALFPATGGALYGEATHGAMASFRRPGARTRIPGLYLAGGSVHPGPGVPMAAMSGRLAAASLVEDFASM